MELLECSRIVTKYRQYRLNDVITIINLEIICSTLPLNERFPFVFEVFHDVLEEVEQIS